MTEKPIPYIVTEPEEWSIAISMLCEFCGKWPECDIVEGMIEAKNSGGWPEGGWVEDPGSGISCLSYEPKKRKPISNEKLIKLIQINKHPEMCDGCAARKGSEASVSLHTRRDFTHSVKNQSEFTCHKSERKGAACTGWLNAIQAKGIDAK